MADFEETYLDMNEDEQSEWIINNIESMTPEMMNVCKKYSEDLIWPPADICKIMARKYNDEIIAKLASIRTFPIGLAEIFETIFGQQLQESILKHMR